MHVQRVELNTSEMLIKYDEVELLFCAFAIEEHDSVVISLMHEVSFCCADLEVLCFLEGKNYKTVVGRVHPRVYSTEYIIKEVDFSLK